MMNQESKQKTNTGNVLAFVFAISLVAVGYLYYEETQKLPEIKIREIVKEIPVEKIKEVIKEVEKEIQVEIPTELTDIQQALITIASNYINAPAIEDNDEVFYGINSFSTQVFIGDSVSEVVSKERIQNKFELNLRKNGISIDEESPYNLTFFISGFWDEKKVRLTYEYGIQIRERVVLVRNGDFRSAMIRTWNWNNIGFAGKDVAEDAMILNTETVSEALANRYLKVVDRENKKVEQDTSHNAGEPAS